MVVQEGGIDIVGFAADGTKKLIAEVKTTHTSETVGFARASKARNRARFAATYR